MAELTLAEYEMFARWSRENAGLVFRSARFWKLLREETDAATMRYDRGLKECGVARADDYQPRGTRPFNDDELLKIEPDVYVEKLADVVVPRSGMILCPFPGHEDRNRSMKVYREAERGVWCFGCLRGGSIYDFAAALWGYKTEGEAFIELRQKIAEELLK